MRKRWEVLLLSSDESEKDILRELLSKHGIVTCAGNIVEMLGLLAGSRFDAFLCDWCFPMGTWREALEEIQRRHPKLPAIVVCRTGGEQEWLEVLEAGAFDMVAAPYREHAVLSVLEHALASPADRGLRSVA